MYRSNNKQKPDAVAESLKHLDPSLDGVRGIVVNHVSTSLLGGLYTSHHFYAIIPSVGPAAAGEGEAVAAGTLCQAHILNYFMFLSCPRR